jgi:hypothetical protein
MELIISDPNSESYEGCSSSSYKEKFECQFGLSTKMVDDEFNMWVSDGEGLDSWFNIFIINQINITNMKNNCYLVLFIKSIKYIEFYYDLFKARNMIII